MQLEGRFAEKMQLKRKQKGQVVQQVAQRATMLT